MADSKGNTAEAAAQEFGLNDAMPDGWRPNEGDVIVGKIMSLTKGWSDYQECFYPIMIIHDEVTDKDVAVHGFHFVLMDRLTALRPRVGERIGLKMGPKIPLKSNPKQSVQTYTVKIEGRSEDIWGDIQNPRVNPQQQTLPDAQPVSTVSDDSDIPF